ncbi:serine/threonine-protein kinase [Actinosynnema sp. CS-041913]|uniref:serine/threonine-protein kinase n=1 Tax=Actinosynnema sp. CS-041913 TaxID=3239917 RepID=UPI003D8AC92A
MHRPFEGTLGGRYRLGERIGAGAMGIVWRAHDPVLDREVAVKQLRWPDLAPAEAEVAKARAMREARNAARLHHPHAITVFDVVVQDDRPWLVMEYLSARSLSELLAEQGPLSPAEAARICGHVAQALAAAHAAGIAHRDVKPSNVLIGHDGAVKLTDFGISRATGDGTLTESGMITGTPAYLAPEVARGEVPGRAADVFSLGATLYAATEGRSPYGTSDNSLALIYRAANGEIEPPTRAGPLTAVLTRLLAVDPAQRPTAADTARLLANPHPQPNRPANPHPNRPADRPRPGWLAPAVAAAILLVVVGTITAVSLNSPSAGVSGPTSTSTPTSTPTSAPTSAPTSTPVQPGEYPDEYTEEQVGEFVRAHYALVASDPHAAWHNLSGSFRPDIEEYASFWGQYDGLRVDHVTVSRPSALFNVEVSLAFERAGFVSVGRYRLGVEPVDGGLLIVSSEQA